MRLPQTPRQSPSCAGTFLPRPSSQPLLWTEVRTTHSLSYSSSISDDHSLPSSFVTTTVPNAHASPLPRPLQVHNSSPSTMRRYAWLYFLVMHAVRQASTSPSQLFVPFRNPSSLSIESRRVQAIRVPPPRRRQATHPTARPRSPAEWRGLSHAPRRALEAPCRLDGAAVRRRSGATAQNPELIPLEIART